jgi:hypothetical protein
MKYPASAIRTNQCIWNHATGPEGLGIHNFNPDVGACAGKAVGHFANLVVEAPPFLDHDQAGVALALMSPERVSAFLRVQIA